MCSFHLARTYTHTHTHTHTYTNTHTNTFEHTRTHTHAHTYTHTGKFGIDRLKHLLRQIHRHDTFIFKFRRNFSNNPFLMGLDAQSGCQFIQIQSGLRAGEENSIVLEDRTEVVEADSLVTTHHAHTPSQRRGSNPLWHPVPSR